MTNYNLPEIIAQQQEAAYKEYISNEENYLDFWDYYWFWCQEKGYFNDRASYQK